MVTSFDKKISLVINKLTEQQYAELLESGKLSSELSDQLFLTIDDPAYSPSEQTESTESTNDNI